MIATSEKPPATYSRHNYLRHGSSEYSQGFDQGLRAGQERGVIAGVVTGGVAMGSAITIALLVAGDYKAAAEAAAVAVFGSGSVIVASKVRDLVTFRRNGEPKTFLGKLREKIGHGLDLMYDR